MQLNVKNFFNKKEFIKITSVTSAIDQNLKSILSNDFLHFPAFIADELSATAGIRKFFEVESYLASIGCYYDDEQNIGKIVLHQCAKMGKAIDNEALYYLKNHLKGDHQSIINEVDKLLFFTNDKSQIMLDDVIKVISNDLIASSDNLCIHFAQKNLSKFFAELSSLMQHNINEVLILRALIRYYLNLYIVVTKVVNGDNLDSAIKSLSPPIFFKNNLLTMQHSECIAVNSKRFGLSSNP
jgi:DNA polymerase-3 subunit delta